MDNIDLTEREFAERARVNGLDRKPSRRRGLRALAAVAVVAVLAAVGGARLWHARNQVPPPPPPPPSVTVSLPLQQSVQPTRRFLGQFAAVENVELRAQVGGTLSAIRFRDGQIVQAGDPLFEIDPRPFEIKLVQAQAQLQAAQAKSTLDEAELHRAEQLKRSDFGTAETVDERIADLRSAQAEIEAAKAAIRDAELDLDYARIRAPFSGRIGAHLVSIGSLVGGSRGGVSPTTLLATIVSLDPIYLEFDMSEADYLAYQHTHRGTQPDDDVALSVDGDGRFDRHGRLDFIDNAVDRSSGTIRARATVPNPDLSMTPGQFARLRVALGPAAPVLLVPAAAVLPDQSRQLVMTVAPDGSVVPKPVETGDLFHGLRVIRSGLAATDRVVIDGLVRARPGSKVTPVAGSIVPDPAGDMG